MKIQSSNLKGIPLYEYISHLYGKELPKKLKFPTPVFNILNGGKHAKNDLSFQEFMAIPDPKISFDKGFKVSPAFAQIESAITLTDSEDGDYGLKTFKEQNNRIYGQNFVLNPTDFKSQDRKSVV